MLWNLIIEFVWAEQSEHRMTLALICGQRIYFSLTHTGWMSSTTFPQCSLLFCLSSCHPLPSFYCPQGRLLQLVNSRMLCSPAAADFVIRNLVTTWSPYSFSDLHPCFLSHIFSSLIKAFLVSLWLITFFGNSLAGDELTSALIPVSPQAVKQASCSFGLVLHCLASSSGSV